LTPREIPILIGNENTRDRPPGGFNEASGAPTPLASSLYSQIADSTHLSSQDVLVVLGSTQEPR